jgi:hypothetical protein
MWLSIIILILVAISYFVFYYFLFKKWRVQIYKRLASDFGLTYKEHPLTWTGLRNSDIVPTIVREASGTLRGKKILIQDVVAGSALSFFGLTNPLFQGTILEVDGEQQQLGSSGMQWMLMPMNSGLVSQYNRIADALKSI